MANGSVYIEQDRCKGCVLCTNVCPQNVLFMNNDVLNAKGYHPAELVDPCRRLVPGRAAAAPCVDDGRERLREGPTWAR